MKKLLLFSAIIFLLFSAKDVGATSGLNFFVNETNVTPAATSTWTDVDVSALVPAGATGAILRFMNTTTATKNIDVRANGSTDTRTTLVTQSGHRGAMVALDSNRIFEGRTSNVTTGQIMIIGYTTDNTTFFTNSVNKTPGTAGSWQDVDDSADIPAGAVGVLVQLINPNSSAVESAGIRTNGSADTFTYGGLGAYTRAVYQASGVDANRIFEAQISQTTVTLFVIGYYMSPMVFETNAIAYVATSTGAWVGTYITGGLSPANADGAIWLIKNTDTVNARNGGTRVNGSTDSSIATLFSSSTNAFFTGLDGARIAQTQVNNLQVDHYVIGYGAPAVPPRPPAISPSGGGFLIF